MAAAKESGAIEYSARVMISMRSVKDEPNIIKIVKNKHGPSDETLYALIDRERKTLLQCDAPASATPSGKAAARDEMANARAKADGEIVLAAVRETPGIAKGSLPLSRARVANTIVPPVARHASLNA